MDWSLAFLKKITIGLNIYKNGHKIGSAITWLGYIGFLTASSFVEGHNGANGKNDFSIAVNYRNFDDLNIVSLIKNVYKILVGYYPVGYLVRDIIEKYSSLDEAINRLTYSNLVSPTYFTVFSLKSSMVITRDSKYNSSRLLLFDNLVQTNCDHDKFEPDILYSCRRRDYLKKFSPDFKTTDEEIISNILKYPVANEQTIYYYIEINDKTYSRIVD